jgi:uncharacterized protein (TIGR03663 family)
VRNFENNGRKSITHELFTTTKFIGMGKLDKTEVLQTETAEYQDADFFNSDFFWRSGCVVVIWTAAFLRLYWLTLKVFHHDEGVNGYFLTTLYRDGIYKYQPDNYHGPTLYFFALASSYLFGLNDFAVRFVTAVFGILTVVLALYLRRYIGTVGALTAGMLLAVSPGMSFISRYFIHEILFAFFTLAIAVAVLKFIEGKKAGQAGIVTMTLLLLVCLLPGTLSFANLVSGGSEDTKLVARIVFFAIEAVIVYLLIRSILSWQDGRAIYLFLASASASLLFATKETAFISLGTMLIAVVCIMIWSKIWTVEVKTWHEPIDLSWKTFRERLGKADDATLALIGTLFVFLFVWVLFFSSFFTYSEGVIKSFEAYDIWTKTGTKDHTQNGWHAYFEWLLKLEAPILFLSPIGALIAVWKSKYHRFALFVALWAFGLLAAYTIIPYKTPWLAINFVMPMAIIAGYGINEMFSVNNLFWRLIAGFLAVAAIGFSTYQAIELNFYKFDDDSKPYVYAHTSRQYDEMIREIGRTAERAGTGKDASIIVVSPDYWPMPWTMRDYKNTAFFGKISEVTNSEVIIGKTDQEDELEENYGGRFVKVGKYALRPGVELLLYEREDLVDPNQVQK